MAQDTLNRIRETELQAKETVKEAQTSKAGIIAKAREEARIYKEDLISKARSDAKKQLEQAESGMQKAMEEAQTRAEHVIGQFTRDLDTKKDKAVKMVIDYII